jgi:hypothetical protein
MGHLLTLKVQQCAELAVAQRLATNLARAAHNHLRWGSTTATNRPLGSVRERNRILQVGLNNDFSISRAPEFSYGTALSQFPGQLCVV